MQRFRLLDTGKLPAAENMALDRILLEETAAGNSLPTVRFLQFSPAAALVGYHQDVNIEIRTDYCIAHHIDINRRHTGGGAILFQESALGWEIVGVPGVGPFRGTFEAILRTICDAAAAGISRLGAPARFRPRNDIEIHGRKISGTGGTSVSGAFLFQGTLLIENEVELFLRALRVPVEKLKKREIESLMDRICFLSELVRPLPSVSEIKEALGLEFARALGIELVPDGLTPRERERFAREAEFFASPQWITDRSRPGVEGEALRSITQTEAGTMRVHLWLGPGGRRIRQALISGDFFAIPDRLVHDLEACLAGKRADPEEILHTVEGFFLGYRGEILGIAPGDVAGAVAAAAEKLVLVRGGFRGDEANELFLLNVRPGELTARRPRWLLLPYCAKDLFCAYRYMPGCEECGKCEIGDCFALAREQGVIPITVQSFDHLIEVLQTHCANGDGLYVGSCCEAFYAKHQREMEAVDAQGVLVNLDSTTCYDLGKGSAAYQGRFDNKTSLNTALLEKILRRLNGTSEAV